jgi:hypothetical protein
VIQEIYALFLAHTVIRTLMLMAATQAQIAPTQISFTAAITIMDNNLLPLGLVCEPRRQHMVESVLKEIGEQRLPKQRVRIQARVVKRMCSRYTHKKPEHWHTPALELDVTFGDIIALVPCPLASVSQTPQKGNTKQPGTGNSSPPRSRASPSADASSSSHKFVRGKNSHAKVCTSAA